MTDIVETRGIDGAFFHIPGHQQIFDVLMGMKRSVPPKPIDIITLTQELRNKKLLEQVGGPSFVTDLFGFLPTAANAEYYLGILEEKYTLREIIRICTEYAARCYEEQDEVTTLLDEVEARICEIGTKRYGLSDRDTTSKELVMEAIHDIENAWENRGKISGISSGFKDLDHITDGFQGGYFYVLAARPSMGKTALAMNIAEHTAIDLKLPTAIFSLEMTKKQLMNRAILGRARVDWTDLRSGSMPDSSFPRMTHAASQLGAAPFHFIDKSPMSWTYLAAVLRRWVKKYGIKIAFVDYLQLLRGARHYKANERQQEVSEISAGLKNLAKELGIPIVILAQLNRQPEGRQGNQRGVPRQSDLRESGSIEQDADVIGLLHREECYAETQEEKKEAQGKANLNIAKNRNGPTGDVPLTFLKTIVRFENYAPPETAVPADAKQPELPKMGGPKKGKE